MRVESSFWSGVIVGFFCVLIGCTIGYFFYQNYLDESVIKLKPESGALYQWASSNGDLTLQFSEDTTKHYYAPSMVCAELNWEVFEKFDFKKDSIQLLISDDDEIYQLKINHIICLSEADGRSLRLDNQLAGLAAGGFFSFLGIIIIGYQFWNEKSRIPRINAYTEEQYKEWRIRNLILKMHAQTALAFVVPYVFMGLKIIEKFSEYNFGSNDKAVFWNNYFYSQEVLYHHFLIILVLVLVEIWSYFFFKKNLALAYSSQSALKSLKLLSDKIENGYTARYFLVITIALIFLQFQSNGYLLLVLIIFSLYKFFSINYLLGVHFKILRKDRFIE
ncbi:MAG: hypothetical protein MUF42_08050 [Cytophagaceae bacterium]|jgi:hypothetical protein|nr:hypothetical protein [Cytophagaceae bacterium]